MAPRGQKGLGPAAHPHWLPQFKQPEWPSWGENPHLNCSEPVVHGHSPTHQSKTLSGSYGGDLLGISSGHGYPKAMISQGVTPPGEPSSSTPKFLFVDSDFLPPDETMELVDQMETDSQATITAEQLSMVHQPVLTYLSQQE